MRPEDEVAELDPALNNEYSAQAYKKWVVTRRAAMMVGRNERVLAIDGDYVHIMAPEDKQRFFDHMKPVRLFLFSRSHLFLRGSHSTPLKSWANLKKRKMLKKTPPFFFYFTTFLLFVNDRSRSMSRKSCRVSF